MPEYIVDCEHVPYGDGKSLVLPISINGHVHERLIRCRDCAKCTAYLLIGSELHICKHFDEYWHVTDPDGFCDRAVPRGDT